MMRTRRGFTLLELLVFTAIFTIVTIGFVAALIEVLHVQSEESTATEVKTQGQFLMQQIQYYVQSARLVDMTPDVATGTLQLRETVASSSFDPTIITIASGTAYLIQGVNGTLQPLTSNKVAITNVSFTRHYNLNNSSMAYGADSVSYSFTMAANAVNATQQYSQTFQSAAAVLAPVSQAVLVQQTSTVNFGTTSTSMSATFVKANATGSLLIAVVANTNSVAVSAADSAGNSPWTTVASTFYAPTSEKLTIFAAQNVKNSTNTVTVTLGGSGGYNASLMLYEYRGVATSSAFDTSAAQTQANTTIFSSGFANPASGAELVFGALYTNPYPVPVVPAAGAGFTTESTLSATNIFVEDEGLFVTGPTAATWSSAQAASSSAIVVTFKSLTAASSSGGSLPPIVLVQHNGTYNQATGTSQWSMTTGQNVATNDLMIVTCADYTNPTTNAFDSAGNTYILDASSVEPSTMYDYTYHAFVNAGGGSHLTITCGTTAPTTFDGEINMSYAEFSGIATANTVDQVAGGGLTPAGNSVYGITLPYTSYANDLIYGACNPDHYVMNVEKMAILSLTTRGTGKGTNI